MREVIFLMAAFLAAEEHPDATPAATISARYATICRDYEHAMAAARGKNAPREELRRISEIRQEAFRALIVAGQDESEKMKAVDWAAIAMAAEGLFQRGECITYSYRAIELAPGTKAAYAPLIRSLLNENRIDDAEAALVSAEKHVNDGTKWHGFHYFLFVKHRDQKQWIKAASHLQTVLETMLREGGENPVETRIAARYPSDYLATTQQAGLEEQGRRQLQVWSRTCANVLEQKSNDDCAGAVEFLHCAALCEVQCAIAKCSPELDYDDYLLLWAEVVYHPRWTSHEEACRLQQMHWGRYVESNAVNVRSWSKIAAGFSQLLNDRFAIESHDRSEVSKSILTKLQAFADSRAANNRASEVDAIQAP